MKASSWIGMVVLLLVVGGVVFAHGPYGRRTQVAAGYAARVLCSCRYVGNRDMTSCRTDLEPGTEIVTLHDDPAHRRVTATIPLLASASATADGDYGCTLDPA